MRLRLATPEDIPAIQVLIPASVRGLQKSLLRAPEGGRDWQRVRRRHPTDSRRNVLRSGGADWGREARDGGLWRSKRKTLYGSDTVPGEDNAWLDPATDPARIRAFFVHPDWPRRGVGSRILEVCEAAARAAGFTRLEMAATLPGVALYKARGYVEVEPFDVPLSNGEKLPVLG
jgi:GNAT superfamily N-acetyltransferase